MAELFASGSESEGEEVSLKTQNEYAKRYDAWREKEELHKLEQKYGENPSEANLTDSDSDDSDEPLEVSEKMEKDFLKTLSLLKTKDPRIYDPGFKCFEEQQNVKEDRSEALIQEKPKKEVKSLAQAFGESDEESDREIFTVEKNTEDAKPKEDKLKEFLTGKVERLGDESEKDLQALKALWSNPKLNDGEAFLRDYILDKKYLADNDEDAEGAADKLLDDDDLEADEKTVEEQGKFERAYNFRFEEPDQDYLKRYPRTMNTIRPKDDRRARKRLEVRLRKEEEKRRKMEEIARLKALKLKEIQAKIAKIKEVTGNKDLAFEEEDIEGEFDPEEHDRRMARIFDEQYYDPQDTEKPVFPDLDEELEIENWEKYEEDLGAEQAHSWKGDAPHCEDDNFNMDAEYDPARARATLLEEIQETLGHKRRNRKRKSKLAILLAKEKPKFDPETAHKTYAEYMEEYYKMDCEDLIGGDLPTRFKYREVVPNSYGLTVEEILLADDKELNKWVPLKKTVKYRPEHVEKSEVKTYQEKGMDAELKRKIIPSLFKEIEEPKPAEESKGKKKKNKKKRKKTIQTEKCVQDSEPSTSTAENVNLDISENAVQGEKEIMKTKKKKKQNQLEKVGPDTVDESKEIAEKVNLYISKNNVQENQVKKTKKKTNKQNQVDNVEPDTVHVSKEIRIDENISKKKRKNKEKGTDQNEVNDRNPDDKSNTNANANGNIRELSRRKRKNKKNKEDNLKNTIQTKEGNKMKRKLTADGNNADAKKMKFSDKKIKNKNCSSDNPMNNLTDERLKAYGLNPKKYRSFLKYKTF